MISEYRFNNVVKPILDTYNEIEDELIRNMANAIKETEGKELKKYTKRLLKASELDRQNVRTLSKYAKTSQRQVKKAFNSIGYETIEKPLYRKAYEKNLIKKNPLTAIDNKKIARVVDNASKETTNYLKLIRNTARTKSKKRYLEIVNKAYLETSAGIYTPEEAIKKALHELADEGITVAQYKRKDGTIANYSIEGVVRRDVMTRARQLSLATQMESIKEMGIEYVSVPAHFGARVDKKNPINNHAGWQGKIYKLEGGNSKYKNFYEITGYGQMLGLGGINCRHFFLPYIFGVSRPPEKISLEANEKVYKLEQQQRALERDVRKWKKREMVDKINGADEQQLAFNRMKIREKQKTLDNFVKSHKELKRQYDREYVQELNRIETEAKIKKNKVTDIREKLEKKNIDTREFKLRDKEFENDLLKHLDHLTDKYPVEIWGSKFYFRNEKIQFLSVDNPYIGGQADLKGIILNSKFFNNKSELIRLEQKGVNNGWHYFVKNKDLQYYTLTHEYGHKIEQSYISVQKEIVKDNLRKKGLIWNDAYSLNDEIDRKLKSDLMKKAIKKLDKKITQKEFKEIYFSKYALSRPHGEWFAEAFAKYYLTKDRDVWIETFGEWLEEYYGKK